MFNVKTFLVFVLSFASSSTHFATAATYINQDENVIQISSTPQQTTGNDAAEKKGFISESYSGFLESFSKDMSLNVVLGDVILLILMINVLALFNKPRGIILISYVFSLKWTFWSNFTTVWNHSNAVTMVSTIVFFTCGLLTVFLFCLNRFETESN